LTQGARKSVRKSQTWSAFAAKREHEAGMILVVLPEPGHVREPAGLDVGVIMGPRIVDRLLAEAGPAGLAGANDQAIGLAEQVDEPADPLCSVRAGAPPARP